MTKNYSVTEAAKELGLSAATIYGLCNQRKLRHERHGLGRGTIRIPEDAIQEYRKSVTVDAGGEGCTPPPAGRRNPVLKHLKLRTTD